MIKSQMMELEKIFADYISDKGLLYRIHKKLKKLNNNKAKLKNKQRT